MSWLSHKKEPCFGFIWNNVKIKHVPQIIGFAHTQKRETDVGFILNEMCNSLKCLWTCKLIRC